VRSHGHATHSNLFGRGHVGLCFRRRLIEHGLSMARRDKLPAFLETGNVRNVAYYQTFGFRVHQVADAPGGGPRIWFMSLRP
jgi:hypothetical protein